MAVIALNSSIEGLGPVILRHLDTKHCNTLTKYFLNPSVGGTVTIPDGLYAVEVISGLFPEIIRRIEGNVNIDDMVVVGTSTGGGGGGGGGAPAYDDTQIRQMIDALTTRLNAAEASIAGMTTENVVIRKAGEEIPAGTPSGTLVITTT